MHHNAYLIAYDVRSPRRLAKLHRTLKKRAIPVQKSVFIAHVEIGNLQALKDTINGIIDEVVDDVRIYRLPANIDLHLMGEAKQAIGLTQLINDDSRNKSRTFMFTHPLTNDVKGLE